MNKLEVFKASILAVLCGACLYIVLTGFSNYFEFYPLQIVGVYFLVKFMYVACTGLFCLMGKMDGTSFKQQAQGILNIK